MTTGQPQTVQRRRRRTSTPQSAMTVFCMPPERSQLRVAHVIQSLEPGQGGTTAAALNLITATLRASEDIKVVVLAPRPASPPEIDERVRSRVDWLWTGPSGVIRPRGLARESIEAMRTRSIDIAHLHGLWSPDLVAIARAQGAAGKAVIWQPHGMLMAPAFSQKRWKKELFYRIGLRAALHGADRVIFSSQGEQRLSLRVAPALERRAQVIPLPVNATSRSLQSASKGTVSPLPGRPLVFLGRLHPVKRIDLTLRAFALALAQRPSLSIVLAGCGKPEYERRLHNLAAKLRIESHVHFVGWLDERDKVSLLEIAGAMALNSRFENFGLAAAEAALYGVPLILTANLPIAVDLQSVNAAFVADAEPSSLASAMIEALTTDEGPRRAERARRWAQTTLDAAVVGDSLARLYREIRIAATGRPQP